MKSVDAQKSDRAGEGEGGWDSNLRYLPPEVIASMNDSAFLSSPQGEYRPRKEFSHLQGLHLDLSGLGLTDKQLIAVSLVFFGGVRKNRAAKAMKISSQAVADHIQAALKKIARQL